jgi:large subunit ribosomal protein L32
LPVKKTSKSKTRSRRSHKKLSPVNYSLCAKCGTAKLPHAACSQCGYVNDTITLKLAKEAES